MAAIHIGISGWRYTPWRGNFYRKGRTHNTEEAAVLTRRLLERFHLDKDLATRPGELAAEGVLS
ncbi:hypothetical protein [Pseudomonas sp.]|jgi:uncharacterized protein YecE (DUF72 family)|uniref:hypothetical protein n=1 Tax=Pseudomonas sp. TaxID=306 RepID=UPI003262D511